MSTCKPILWSFIISVQFSLVWIHQNLFFILMLMDIGLFSVWGYFRENLCGCFCLCLCMVICSHFSWVHVWNGDCWIVDWVWACSSSYWQFGKLSQFSLPSVISGSSSHSTCLYLACHPKIRVFDMIGPQTLFNVYLSGSNQESRNHFRCFNKRSLMEGFGHTGDGKAEKPSSQ